MKSKFIFPLIAVAAIMASCQNTDSGKATNDSTTNADSANHAMSDTSNTVADTSIMASINKMMNNMHKMEKSGNADYDLAASLKEHHMGAVEMADAELINGTDGELKKMAQAITEKQGQEIKDLDALIGKHKSAAKNYDPIDTEKGLGKAMSDNMMAMMDMPKHNTASVDEQFATLMSKHHADGVKMGNTILQYAKDPMLKSMAKKMIADQIKEINAFEQWISNHKH